MPERKVHLDDLHREYDRLFEMLAQARPASDSKEDMLAATADMRRVLDNTELLFQTVAVETYDQTSASFLDMGAVLGSLGGRGEAMARNNAQRWLATRRLRLPARRAAEGLPARLGA